MTLGTQVRQGQLVYKSVRQALKFVRWLDWPHRRIRVQFSLDDGCARMQGVPSGGGS